MGRGAAPAGRPGSLSPAVIITVLGLLGTPASVLGNEASIRFGRRRLVLVAMGLSIVSGCSVGFLGSTGYWIAAALIVLYGIIIWLDSSSLTAGAAGSADPARRGATLAVHSMLGYAGGFVGPLMMGWVLDLVRRHVAARVGPVVRGDRRAMALGLVAFAVLRPRPGGGSANIIHLPRHTREVGRGKATLPMRLSLCCILPV